jgi:hypothetical protein
MGAVAFALEKRVFENETVKWQISDLTSEAFDDFMTAAKACADGHDSADVDKVLKSSKWTLII